MVKENRIKPSLTRPATFLIEVPGHLDECWSEWAEKMTIKVENDKGDMPITTLTGAVDQAALYGMLLRLYSLGIPLISVHCLEVKECGI